MKTKDKTKTSARVRHPSRTPSLTELLRADDELRTVWALVRKYDLREQALVRLDRAISHLEQGVLTVN